MKIVRNNGYVKYRKRRARWSAFLGFLLLISVSVIWFFPGFVLFAYGMLFLGYIVFSYGMQQLAKWSRSPRNDVVLDDRLKSFPDKYALIHYGLVGKTVVEHMLVHPGGVIVLTARAVTGQISGHGSKWRKRGFGFMRFFGSGPSLGNPSFETQQSIQAIEASLAEAQLEVDVDGAIVFVDPRVNLDADDTDYPAMTIDELPGFVHGLPVDNTFRPAERQAVIEQLAGGGEMETTERVRTRRPVRSKRPVKVKKKAA